MAVDPRTPVIIGVGQQVDRPATLADGREPVALIEDAARAAVADAGLGSVPALDSVRIVRLLSWRYIDPALLVYERLGLDVRETCYTPSGGNTPQTVLNLTAAEIQRGERDCVLLAGGETWRTRMRSRRGGDIVLPWPKQDKSLSPRMLGEEATMSHPAEEAQGITQPVQVYPMFETALRAATGEAPDEHLVKVSKLWERFSAVAAANPYAWVRTAYSAEEIRTPSPSNRMIGFPYPKMMNSNNDVEMAAAVLMCSAARARDLGVPQDRWVFLHAGTDAHDTYVTSHRWELHRSPAIRVAGPRAMALAGCGRDDLAIIDLYSCFPAMVQISAGELEFSLDRQLTQTGGLPFGGGPWNNYVMHAVCTVVQRCREQAGQWGFVHANGGFATKHAFGLYNTTPPAGGFRWEDCQPAVDAAAPRRDVAMAAEAAGPAVVEGYTVMHSREGAPEVALAACRLADGRRAWASSTDVGLATAMCEGEWVGRAVALSPTGTLSA